MVYTFASPKYTYYKYLIDVYSLQYYLYKFIPVTLRKCITKFRLSSHNLATETGRYNTTDRSKRTCFVCVDEIEDEYHFIMACPLFNHLRQSYYMNVSVFIIYIHSIRYL